VDVAVTDHGMGIALDAQERIFERFERAVSAAHYGGLGMGLWIARQAARALGGSVRLTSAPGKGSTFVVTLPRWNEKADAPPAAAPQLSPS
jgi:signal transduction histidine kinase